METVSELFRSMNPDVFYQRYSTNCSWKTAAPKIFNKIHNKYLYRSLFSSSNRKKTPPKIFSVDFGKLLGTHIFGSTPEWLFLKILYKDIFKDNYWPFKLPSHFKNRAPIECTYKEWRYHLVLVLISYV